MNGIRGSLACVLALVACGTDIRPGEGDDDDTDHGGTCPRYEVPAGTDLMQPAISFKTQVMPIFNATCNNAQCHGTTENPSAGLYLGSWYAHLADAPQVHALIVDVPAQTLPDMPLISPGDPAHSFLMHKLDADQCAFEGDCGDIGCGDRMPRDGTNPLPLGNRDAIRRWIAQGALDN